MKKHFLKVICVAFFFIVFACNKKKLTEVVEVPLPSAEEKITMGIPDDVKANDGSFQLEKLAIEEEELWRAIKLKHSDISETDIVDYIKRRLIKENLS